MSQWKILKSQSLFQAGFFSLRVDELQFPDGRVMPKYYVFELADWVNVVPVTSDCQMVLLRQYRHGAGQEFLEIPGGSTEPGADEDPRLAGERELLEETGYQASQLINCGFHYPNPALQNNRMHTFLALGCRKIAEPCLDPYEVLTVETKPVTEVARLWRAGEFKHSLIYVSLGLAMNALKEAGFEV